MKQRFFARFKTKLRNAPVAGQYDLGRFFTIGLKF
jgi:hypothetical protein